MNVYGCTDAAIRMQRCPSTATGVSVRDEFPVPVLILYQINANIQTTQVYYARLERRRLSFDA